LLYSAFGLRLRTDRAVPGLLAARGAGAWDVDISLQAPAWPVRAADLEEARPWFAGPPQDPDGQPSLTVRTLPRAELCWLRFSEGAEFLVDRAGNQVWARWSPPLTREDTVCYLLGPVLGFVLALRGRLCLHGSALAVGGRAFALVGASGAGKSTTAAALALRGQAVLTDDVLPLEACGEHVHVLPGYPRLRLWPDAVGLCGRPDALPALTPTWAKRYLDLTRAPCRFQAGPLPLAAVYLLGPPAGDCGAPAIEPVPLAAGLVELLANKYLSLPGPEALARDFTFVSRLVAHTPVRRVTAQRDPRHLPQLCAALLDDFRAVTSSRPPT
jgi:hypothetical protein